MTEASEYLEKQYLGRDYNFISIRLVLATFCFLAYYFSENRDKNAEIFLVVGCAILVISILMLFILHYKTVVINNAVLLNGIWKTNLVKIDLNSIILVEIAPYSNFILNNPVYNLHRNGTIRFYAGGKDAVKLTDRDGLIYIIGTQRPKELFDAIKETSAKYKSFSR